MSTLTEDERITLEGLGEILGDDAEHEILDSAAELVLRLDRELVKTRQDHGKTVDDLLRVEEALEGERDHTADLVRERDAERARRERLDRELDALAYEIETSSSGYQLRVAAKRARTAQRALNEEARAVLTEEHH